MWRQSSFISSFVYLQTNRMKQQKKRRMNATFLSKWLKAHTKRQTHWNNGAAYCNYQTSTKWRHGNRRNKLLRIAEMIWFGGMNWNFLHYKWLWMCTICHKNQHYTLNALTLYTWWCLNSAALVLKSSSSVCKRMSVIIFALHLSYLLNVMCVHARMFMSIGPRCSVLWDDGMIHFVSCTF